MTPEDKQKALDLPLVQEVMKTFNASLVDLYTRPADEPDDEQSDKEA